MNISLSDKKITIRRVLNPRKYYWNDLIKSSGEGTPYGLLDYINLGKNSDKKCFVMAFDSDGKTVGAAGGRIRGNIPLFGFLSKVLWIDIGPIVSLTEKRDIIKLKINLLKELKHQSKKLGLNKIISSDYIRDKNFQAFESEDFKGSSFLAYPVDLKKHYNKDSEKQADLSWDEILKRKKLKKELRKKPLKLSKFSFKKEFRRLIRDAKKINNLEIIHELEKKNNVLVEDFQKVIEVTYNRAININPNSTMQLKSIDYFTELLSKNDFKTHISAAFIDGKIVSGMLILSDGQKAVLHLAGSVRNIPKGVSNLLYAEVIEWLKIKNHLIFDPGGGPKNATPNNPSYGVLKFKEGLGVPAVEFKRWEFPINKVRANLLDLLSKQKPLVRFLRSKLNF